jgi:N utilization substance protein A
MSRTSEKFLENCLNKKFQVFDGLIMVKNVVRIPGEKQSSWILMTTELIQ